MTVSDDSRLTDPRAYVRLAAQIRSQIRSGMLQAGKPVPSITTLVGEHHHARPTYGKAYRLLQQEGLVEFIPGLGYFVTRPHAVSGRPSPARTAD